MPRTRFIIQLLVIFAVVATIFLVATSNTITQAEWRFRIVQNTETGFKQVEAVSSDGHITIVNQSEGANTLYSIYPSNNVGYVAEVFYDDGVWAKIETFYLNGTYTETRTITEYAHLQLGRLLISPSGRFTAYSDENESLVIYDTKSNAEYVISIPIGKRNDALPAQVYSASFSPGERYFVLSHVTKDDKQALYLVDLTQDDLRAERITDWSNLWLVGSWLDDDHLVIIRQIPKSGDALVQIMNPVSRESQNVILVSNASYLVRTVKDKNGYYQVKLENPSILSETAPLYTVLSRNETSINLVHLGEEATIWQNPK